VPQRFELEDHHRLWRTLDVTQPLKEAEVYTDLVYMPALEEGHSRQAPDGMVDINLANGAANLNRALDRAIDWIIDGADPDAALEGALNDGALFLLREIVVDTPIDTGRARGSWEVTLADGTRHDSVGLGLTPSPSSEAASRDRDRAREGKRGVRRRIRSNEEG
jgi:hypothetical protein